MLPGCPFNQDQYVAWFGARRVFPLISSNPTRVLFRSSVLFNMMDETRFEFWENPPISTGALRVFRPSTPPRSPSASTAGRRARPRGWRTSTCPGRRVVGQRGKGGGGEMGSKRGGWGGVGGMGGGDGDRGGAEGIFVGWGEWPLEQAPPPESSRLSVFGLVSNCCWVRLRETKCKRATPIAGGSPFSEKSPNRAGNLAGYHDFGLSLGVTWLMCVS